MSLASNPKVRTDIFQALVTMPEKKINPATALRVCTEVPIHPEILMAFDGLTEEEKALERATPEYQAYLADHEYESAKLAAEIAALRG